MTVFFNKPECRVVIVCKNILVNKRASNITKKVDELEAPLEKIGKLLTKRLKLLDDMVILVGQSALADYVLTDVIKTVTITKEDDYIVFEVSKTWS